jgi:hypothetical protein
MPLPLAFCWSKFGAEAGEGPRSIVERKERERRRNGGIFLWGVGTSIWPSLLALLEAEPDPRVLFTPMVSPPATSDASPSGAVLWQEAKGFDGRPFAIPCHSLVTSSFRLGQAGHRHYALVCRSDHSLLEPSGQAWIDHAKLRNLRTGRQVGRSQVTSVVRRLADDIPEQPRYKVAFEVALEHPYQVVLTNGRVLPRLLRAEHQLTE